MPLHGWESALDGRRVLLTEPVVRELRMLAINGFVALRRRGMEVGGILYGRVEDGGEVRIEGFREAPCEHRYGPSYALSEADRAALSELLERSPLPVVGFFRSFASRDPVIEEADEAFVREHFPRGDFVCLMLQPLSAENCKASFRFFRDGQLLPDTEEPSFAFDPQQMPLPDPLPGPVLVPMKDKQAEPPPDRAMEEAPAANSAPRRMRWWIPALISLASAVCGASVFELWTLARQPRWTDLHLDARPVDGRLEVSWDAAATRALNPTRGLLAVTDGDAHRNLDLVPAQIRAGKYTYTPLHAEVAVRLILYAKDLGVAGDTVRVAAAPSPPMPARTVTAETGPRDRADRMETVAPGVAEPATASRVAKPPSVVRQVQPLIPEGIRSRLSEPVVIPVEVEVSDQGRVVRAMAESEAGDGLHRYLEEKASKAAREWRFTAARTKSGERVAASKTIQFVFTPSTSSRAAQSAADSRK